jgi:hypothetical protein
MVDNLLKEKRLDGLVWEQVVELLGPVDQTAKMA